MNHISAQILANVATRRTQFEGKDTLVAPVILLVEGVHAGSNGPLYYSSSVLKAYAQAWNGVPLPVHHPEQDGQPVSCNSPDIVQSRSVGRLWNVRFEETPKPRLKGEIWVDVVKCASIAPEVLEALKSNRPLEVSTGLFSTDEVGAGTWNTEDYHATVKDMRPDHLALLPGVTGACSWQDGCGVRANMNPNHDPDNGEFSSGAGGGSSKVTSGGDSIIGGDKAKQAIAEYQNVSYAGINYRLRNQQELDAREKAVVKHLDKNMTDTLPEGTVLYRGMRVSKSFNLTEGQVLQFDNYVSTSYNKKAAETFGKPPAGEKGIVFSIKTSGNVKGMDMITKLGESSTTTKEKEFLLPRGSKFKITGSKTIGKVTHIEGELV